MTTLFGKIIEAGGAFNLDFERVFTTGVNDVWAAVTSATDSTRVAGVSWDERYEILKPIWEQRFGELRG